MPNNENRGRRVTDKPGNLLDLAQQALRIQQAEHDHALLAQRVTSGMENVQNSLGDTNRILRGLSEKVSEFARLQHSHDANKEAIARIEESVGEIRALFERQEERSQERWAEHEQKNEATKEVLEGKIAKVREDTIRIITVGAVVTLLGGAVISGFLWNINRQFNDEHETHAEQRNRSDENRRLIDKTKDDLYDVKLYLARGGRIPDEPYIPPSQRSKPDEQPKPANHTGQP